MPLKSVYSAFVAILLLIFLSTPPLVFAPGTVRDDPFSDATSSSGNVPPQQIQSPTPIQTPNAQAQLPAGATAGVRHGTLESTKSDSSKNNNGGETGKSTDLKVEPDGTTKTGTSDTAKTQTAKLEDGTQVEIGSDGKTMKAASAKRFETSTPQSSASLSQASNARQEADGTLTAEKTQQAAISSQRTDDATLKRAMAGEPPVQPLLVLKSAEGLRVEPDGQASVSRVQDMRLYLPGSQAPAILETNAKDVRIKLPWAPTALKDRIPMRSEQNLLSQTLLKLSNKDFSMKSADSFVLSGAEHANPRGVEADIQGRIYHISWADEVKIGNLELKDVKDATILINSGTAIFLKEGQIQRMFLDKNPIEYTTTSKDNKFEAAKPAVLAQKEKRRTIRVEGGVIKAAHDPSSNKSNTFDIIEAGNKTEITIMEKRGIECARITPAGAYTHKTPNPKSIFTIAVIRNPHQVCLRKGREQAFPTGPESTTADFTQNFITSQGTAQYRRFHTKEGRILSPATEPRADPPMTASLQIQLDTNLEQILQMRSWNLTKILEVKPDNFLTITYVNEQDGEHRYLRMNAEEDPSENIIDSLLSRYIPEAFQLKGSWNQKTDDGQPRIRALTPGNPLIQSMIQERKNTIEETR